MKKKTHAFSVKALNSTTPKWAKNMFRVTLLLTSVASYVIVSDETVAAETAERIILYLRALDLLVYGLSKMFGVEIQENES